MHGSSLNYCLILWLDMFCSVPVSSTNQWDPTLVNVSTQYNMLTGRTLTDIILSAHNGVNRRKCLGRFTSEEGGICWPKANPGGSKGGGAPFSSWKAC